MGLRDTWGGEGCPCPQQGQRGGIGKAAGMGESAPSPPAAPHLSAGLGGDLKGGLEGSSLLRGEDGPRSLGPPRVLPVIPTALTLAALTLSWLHVPIFILALHCGGHNSPSGLYRGLSLVPLGDLLPARILSPPAKHLPQLASGTRGVPTWHQPGPRTQRGDSREPSSLNL